MSAPHLPAQGAKMMRAMGCIAEGLHEPGWGALKHSSFLPALTPQRENSTNLINASTVARSIKISAHLVFCSPFSPSKVLQFHIPPLSKLGIMLSFQPRSCASICLEHPCPPIKLKLPTLQGPHSRPPFLGQVWPSCSFHPSLELSPTSWKFLQWHSRRPPGSKARAAWRGRQGQNSSWDNLHLHPQLPAAHLMHVSVESIYEWEHTASYCLCNNFMHIMSNSHFQSLRGGYYRFHFPGDKTEALRRHAHGFPNCSSPIPVTSQPQAASPKETPLSHLPFSNHFHRQYFWDLHDDPVRWLGIITLFLQMQDRVA